MIRKLSFRADPAPPYHAAEFYSRKAVRDGIQEPFADINLRRKIVIEAADYLSQLLDIPADFNIVIFTKKSLLDKAINKAFKGQKLTFENDGVPPEPGNDIRISKRFDQMGNNGPGRILDEKSLLCFRDLDPYNGRKTAISELFYRSDYSTQMLIHGDVSYTVPTGILEYSQVHSFVFQTEYGFGMAPGVIIWISREPFYGKVMAHLEELVEFTFHSSGPDGHRTIRVSADIDKLYVLTMIILELKSRGLNMIRNEIKYKSIVLCNAFKESPHFEPLLQDLKDQSEHIICGRSKASKKELEEYFSRHGIEVDLYEDFQGYTIVRIANYPVHSKEQVEYLSDLLKGF